AASGYRSAARAKKSSSSAEKPPVLRVPGRGSGRGGGSGFFGCGGCCFGGGQTTIVGIAGGTHSDFRAERALARNRARCGRTCPVPFTPRPRRNRRRR